MNKRNWTVATAALLLAFGGAAAAAQQGTAAPGETDRGAAGHDHSSGGDAQSGTGHGMMGHGMMGQGGMGHGGMNHGGMGGGGMGCMSHGGMDHGDAAAKGSSAEQQSEGRDKHSGGMMMKRLCGAGEHVEGRLAFLKAELKLTAAQAPQWTAFADAYRAAGEKVAQYCASAKERNDAPKGVLEQFGMMERNMTAHLESVRTIKSAAEPLFGVLSEEQKKTAEEVMTGVMGLGMTGMGQH